MHFTLLGIQLGIAEKSKQLRHFKMAFTSHECNYSQATVLS